MLGAHAYGMLNNACNLAFSSGHLHLPSGLGVQVAIWDVPPATSAAQVRKVDILGLVDKCRGADARSCKIIPGHHSFNGSATSFVQRTAWDSAGNPTTNVTISSGHVRAGASAADEMVLVVEPSHPHTTLWAVFTSGFYFDCAVQVQGKVMAGEFLRHCGTVAESASAQPGRTLVTAQPHGFDAGYFTVECPGCGATTVLPGTNVSLPPHSIAVPLRNGAVSLSAIGPTPISPQPPKPIWRSTRVAQGIVAERLAEVTASLDGDYPRAEVGQMRDSAEAIRTVMGWNTVWDQRVKVITPVSRTFGKPTFDVNLTRLSSLASTNAV